MKECASFTPASNVFDINMISAYLSDDASSNNDMITRQTSGDDSIVVEGELMQMPSKLLTYLRDGGRLHDILNASTFMHDISAFDRKDLLELLPKVEACHIEDIVDAVLKGDDINFGSDIDRYELMPESIIIECMYLISMVLNLYHFMIAALLVTVLL